MSALTLGTTGTDLSSTVATGTSTPVITLNVPTASASNRGALSSTDWSTFNGKQAALVSGTNIKTINGNSILGSGDLITDTLGFTYITKSANQDVTNSTTFVDDTDLQFSVVANGIYIVEMQLIYSGNNTAADYKCQFILSTGIISGRGSYLGYTTGSSIGTFAISSVGTNAITPLSLGVIAADVTQPITCTMYYTFTASANTTFKFQFANNTAAASAISRTLKGSYLRYKQIG